MTRPLLGPRLIVGTLLGVAIGALALISIYLAGAAVLLGLYLLGRHAPNSPVFQEHAEAHRADVARRDRLATQARRNAYWMRFPIADIPGETRNGRHLDRVFMPYAECDQGHFDFHHMGQIFVRDGRDRVARSCVEPGCTCTWSELLIGGVA